MAFRVSHTLLILATLILSVPIFLFILFPLASCTSSKVSNLYLATYQMISTTDSKTSWLRLGYYGICMVGGDFKSATCTRTSGGRSAHDVNTALFGSNSTESLTAVTFALDLQRNAFVAFMTAAGVDWIISLILCVVIVALKSRAGRGLRMGAKATAATSAVLMVAASWATSSAVSAMEALDRYAGDNAKNFSGGSSLVALQWVAAVAGCFYTWAVFGVVHDEDEGKADLFSYDIGRSAGR